MSRFSDSFRLQGAFYQRKAWVSGMVILCLSAYMGLGVSCSQSSPTQAESAQRLSLVVPSTLIDTLKIDSIYFEIDGLEFQSWSLKHFQSEVELPILSPGESQILNVEVYEEGTLRYIGQEIFDVRDDQPLKVAMNLIPQFRYLKFHVPLGLDNPLGIAGGELTLGELKDSLPEGGFMPYFEIGPVNLGESLPLEVVLWNSPGEPLFRFNDTILISNEDESMSEWIFETVGVAGSLNFMMTDLDELKAQFVFKASQAQYSLKWKDLIFSELMVQPTSSGSQLEYIEIVNTRLDSLVLDSCKLTKSRNANSLSSVIQFGNMKIPPQSSLIIGGDEVESDVALGNFTLTNTRLSLLILCQDILVDSIHYETSPDSLNYLLLEEGRSWEIKWDQWEQGENMSAWCNSNSKWSTLDSLDLYGSPGEFHHCNETTL